MANYEEDDWLDTRARRGGSSRSRRVETQYRHVAPGTVPPIYPARPVRRSSTLPVRFADETITEPATSYRETRPRNLERDDTSRSHYRAEPAWDESYSSGSDEETRPAVRRRSSRADESEPEVVVREREGSAERYKRFPRRSRSKSRSRSLSRSPPAPIIIRNIYGRERLDSPASSVDLDYEREAARRTERRLKREYERDYLGTNNEIEDDKDWGTNAYSFKLSRHSKSLLSRESTLGSVSEASEDNDSPETVISASAPTKSPQLGKTLLVSQSKYTGDGVIGGIQSAELTLMEETTTTSRKGTQPVFRWVQFEDPTMNFDRFEAGCQSIIGLTESQKTGITRVFGRVRRKADKPVQVSGGGKVRFMLPGVLHDILPKEPGSSNTKPKAITWMVLPYFCLQKYSGNYSGLPAASHPTRTLLQARFSLAKKERDMQQAVCQLLGTPQDHCFHIAQVWYLVLGADLLITCSGIPIPTLLGKHLSLPNLPTTQPNHRRRQTHLLVSSGHLLWSLPLSECQSWFNFMSHFWEYWPRRLEFSLGGKAITLETWQKTIDRASRSLTCLDVDTRPRPREHARGVLLFSNPAGLESKEIADQSNNSQEKEGVAQDQPSNEIDQSISEKKEATIPKSPKTNDQPSLHPDAAKQAQDSPKTQLKDVLGNTFHVFTWLNEEQPKTWQTASQSDMLQGDLEKCRTGQSLPFDLNESNMNMDLEEIHLFLQQEVGFQERFAYEECPQNSRANIYEKLRKELEDITEYDRDNTNRRRNYEEMVDLVNKSEILFQFFLPLGYEGPTVEKFWGALFQILSSMSAPSGPRSSHRRRTESDFGLFIRRLGYYTPIPQLFKGFLSTADGSERSTIEIPEEFPRAWLHLLMTFVFCSTEKLTALFEEQSVIFNQLMDEGMRKVVLNFKQKSLLEYAVFRPAEMASLVNFVLLGDITSQTIDTSDTYFEYLSSLESAIEASPLDRSHQDKITLFKQEISVVLETLEEQQRILDLARSGSGGLAQSSDIFRAIPSDPIHRYAADSYAGDAYLSRTRSRSRSYAMDARSQATTRVAGTTISQLDPTDPTGIQGLLTQDSQALIDRKIREFREMNIRATELEAWNIQKIDYNKDRQEAAIYAFTIVTIVFLPISAVAGILGMNVNDIRNMELNQWVFWAVSLPLAVIIIVLCLIWAGELENFWNGFRNLWGKKKFNSGGQYVPLVPNDNRPVNINDYEEDNRYLVPAPNSYRPLHGRNRRSQYF